MTVITKQALTATSSPHNEKVLNWLAHLGPALLTVLFIWLPFGFVLTGLLEEWGVIGLFSQVGVFFLTDVTSAIPSQALRPLTILPHALAYYLDPATFNNWHVLLIIALVIKGWALSVITTRITDSIKWGMLASILVILYPADTMQLSFRSIHINWALSLALLGSVTLLQAVEPQLTKLRSYSQSLLSAILLASACAMYEASLLLTALPALVLLVKFGFKNIISNISKHLAQHLFWLSGALLYIIYAIYTAPLINSYQGALAGSSALSTLKMYYPNLLKVGIVRSILSSWIDAFHITLNEISSYWYLAAATATLLLLMFVITKKTNRLSKKQENPVVALICRLALVGLLLICIGYAPFLLSPSHMAISQRTFLFTAPGATMLFISLLLVLNYFTKLFTQVVGAALIFFGLGAQLFQFHHYIDISRRQQAVLKDIVHNFDGQSENKTILIIDYSNQLNHTWMFLNPDMGSTLSYIYGKHITNIQVCYMPSHEWQLPSTDSTQRKGTCEEGPDGWAFNYPPPVSGPGMPITAQLPSLYVPKSQVINVAVGDNGEASINHELDSYRQNLDTKTTAMSVRFRGITETTPWFDFFKFRDQIEKDEYYWSFGTWWNLDIPTKGSGWRDVDWEASGISHTSTAWINAPLASLDFDLRPKNVPYTLTGQFDIFTSEKSRIDMKFLINGTEITTEWGDAGNFKGTVNPQILKPGKNTIEFIAPTDVNYYGYSARLDWVKISKKTP